MCKLFHIVMAGAIDVVGRILLLGSPVKLLSVVKRYDLVTFAMDHIHGAIYVRHAIKFISDFC